MTIAELVRTLGGRVVLGDPETVVTEVGAPDTADGSTLIFGDTQAAAERAFSSAAAAIVVPTPFCVPEGKVKPVIAADQPRLWFAQAGKLLAAKPVLSGVHASAVVEPGAVLGDEVVVGPLAVVGRCATVGARSRIEAGAVIGEGVVLGEDCWIHPRAVLYPGTRVGNRAVVHAGAVLGADGFGYVRDRTTGAYTQFPQVGTLVIEDDVEVGANTTIDRGALRETRIRRGVKLDNLVHIGHNCDIGEDVVMASLTGISGSSTVGAGAILAGQVGVGDHAHIGPGVILGGQAGILSGKTVSTTGTVLWGTPAKPLKEYLRELAVLARLARRKKE